VPLNYALDEIQLACAVVGTTDCVLLPASSIHPPLVMLVASLQGSAAAAGLTLTAKSAALLPEGGASDVGASLCKYAADQKVREQAYVPSV
jgi:hypothetical protein